MTTQPFYNSGTAGLTNGSTAMVGTGTFWLGNIRPYDRVVGLDGKEAIVSVVVDNTHITLLRNWAGTTQASAAYEIWMSPDEIFLQTITRSIMEALQSSALTGISGLVPANNTYPYFDATAQAALGGVSLGTTDNSLVRSDGAGGYSFQGSKATLADDGTLTINKNTATLPASISGTVAQFGGVDGISARILLDTFATQGILTIRRANGTAVARSGLLINEVIAGFAGYGAYDVTNYSSGQRAAVNLATSEAWSATNQGTEVRVLTTPNGSTTVRQSATFGQDGSFTPIGLVDLSGAAAGQIKFPVTQNPSSDANTLDDYEEGTFTPILGASSGTLTSASATCSYTKIGNRVLIRIIATIVTNGTAAGYITATMPFTPSELATMSGRETQAVGWALSVQVNNGSATVIIQKYDGTYTGADGRTFVISGHYKV